MIKPQINIDPNIPTAQSLGTICWKVEVQLCYQSTLNLVMQFLAW